MIFFIENLLYQVPSVDSVAKESLNSAGSCIFFVTAAWLKTPILQNPEGRVLQNATQASIWSQV